MVRGPDIDFLEASFKPGSLHCAARHVRSEANVKEKAPGCFGRDDTVCSWETTDELRLSNGLRSFASLRMTVLFRFVVGTNPAGLGTTQGN